LLIEWILPELKNKRSHCAKKFINPAEECNTKKAILPEIHVYLPGKLHVFSACQR
jgi:hypothetical protein